MLVNSVTCEVWKQARNVYMSIKSKLLLDLYTAPAALQRHLHMLCQ